MTASLEQDIALSDLTFGSKISFLFRFAIKTAALFAIFMAVAVLKTFSLSVGSQFFGDDGLAGGLIFFCVCLLIYCAVYVIYFVISEGVIKDMIGGLIISLIGSVLVGIFPPLGIIVAIIGLISMIRRIISVVQLIPLLLLGVLLTLFLFLDTFLYFEEVKEILKNEIPQLQVVFRSYKIYGLNFTITYALFPYIFLSLLISVNLAFKYSLKMAMFRQVIIFIAVVIIALIIAIIKSKLERAVCEPRLMQQTSVKGGKIWVKPYQRLDGTLVSGYWRMR